MTGGRSSDGPADVRGPRAHVIGPGGVVVISVGADAVRVRGVDGTETRVVSPAVGAGLETRADAGRFAVRTVGHGAIDRTQFPGIQLGGRAIGRSLRVGISGTVEVEVPRDARVEIDAVAGDVTVRDVRGGVAARTASGDISVKRAAGRIAVEATSGDIHVDACGPAALEAHSISGDVDARAPRFERVAVETVSGDVELSGTFAAGAEHAVSTVSGDVEVAPSGGLTLALATVSGRVECSHPDRRDGDGRRRPLVIGDGAARMSVRTMSGDVEVRAGRSLPADPADAVGARPEEALPGAAAQPPEAPGTLAVLEALARGEIDVAEAERRLAGVPDTDGATDAGDRHG